MTPSVKKTVGARFRTTKPKDQIQQELIQTISRLGKTQIDDNGEIKIDASRYNGIGQSHKLYGQFIENAEGKYTVNITYSAKRRMMSPGAMILALLTLGISGGILSVRYASTAAKIHGFIDQVAKDIEFAFND